MGWIQKSGKSILISIGFTLLFILPFPAFRESWAYFFSYALAIFELPVLMESDELPLLKKVGLMIALGAVCILLIRFFCEAERVGRYLLFYAAMYGAVVLTLILKRCYSRWKSSRNKA